MLINLFAEWGGQLSRLLQRDGKQDTALLVLYLLIVFTIYDVEYVLLWAIYPHTIYIYKCNQWKLMCL